MHDSERGLGRRGFRGGPFAGGPGFGPGRPGSGPGPRFAEGTGLDDVNDEGDAGPSGRARGFGPGRGGPGRGFGGPPDFGGFGPGMRGFGPGFAGGWHEGRRGGRRQRGNVRAAVLALLAEEPRHGYAIMTELAERSGGLWRPSPGSVYPVLQQLQDEGLVTVDDQDGRKVFSLSREGRVLVSENPEEYHEPWKVAESGPGKRVQGLMTGLGGVAAAAQQVARLGTAEQHERANAVLEEARRSLYRILAEDGAEDPATAQE